MGVSACTSASRGLGRSVRVSDKATRPVNIIPTFNSQDLTHAVSVVSEVFPCAFATAARTKVVKMNPARMMVVFVK